MTFVRPVQCRLGAISSWCRPLRLPQRAEGHFVKPQDEHGKHLIDPRESSEPVILLALPRQPGSRWSPFGPLLVRRSVKRVPEPQPGFRIPHHQTFSYGGEKTRGRPQDTFLAPTYDCSARSWRHAQHLVSGSSARRNRLRILSNVALQYCTSARKAAAKSERTARSTEPSITFPPSLPRSRAGGRCPISCPPRPAVGVFRR